MAQLVSGPNIGRLLSLTHQNLFNTARLLTKASHSSLAQHYEGVFPKEKFQPQLGDGPYLIGQNNERMLCCNSAYGAALNGYSSCLVTERIKEQYDQLALSSRAFHYPLLDQYAEKLTEIYDPILGKKSQILFKEGGAAAVDASIKIAKLHGHKVKGIEDGKQKILYAGGHDLFHGRSEGVMPPAQKNDDDPMTNGFGQVNHPAKMLIELNSIEQL